MRNIRDMVVHVLSRKGLHLFEIITLFIICSIAYVACIGGVFEFGARSQRDMNRHRMLLLNMCLQAYHWGHSTWPPELGVLACEGQDMRTCVPHANPLILKDPWGTPYLYKFSAKGFSLTSLGADRRAGGAGLDEDVTQEGP